VDFPAGVRPRGDRIQIRYMVNNRRQAETLDIRPNAAGIAEAVRVRKRRMQAVKYGLETPAPIARHTFASVAQDYLDRAEVKYSTRNSYRDALNIYWGALGSRDIGDILAQDLITLDDALDWPSRKTRLNALIPLRQVFRFAVARGYRADNPASGLHGKRERDKRGPDPYTAAERDALLTWLQGHGRRPYAEYFTLAFYTGMRTGELLGLRWADVDGDSIMVQQAYVRRQETGIKTGKARRVLLLPEAEAAIKAMPRPIRGGRIFTAQHGRPLQSGYHANKVFRAAHEASGIRHRTGPYPWRHTFASLALMAGVRPALIAEMLGHSVQMLLTTYARWMPSDDDRAELNKMTVSAKPNSKELRR